MTTLRPLALTLAFALAACGGGGGLFNRDAPDELAVGRQAPLVVPPDYSLVPPRPGAPRPLAPDAQSQALEALFGQGTQPPKSPAEQQLLEQSGAAQADPTARSTAGDPDTVVVDKGAFVKQLLNAPAGSPNPAVARINTGG